MDFSITYGVDEINKILQNLTSTFSLSCFLPCHYYLPNQILDYFCNSITTVNSFLIDTKLVSILKNKNKNKPKTKQTKIPNLDYSNLQSLHVLFFICISLTFKYSRRLRVSSSLLRQRLLPQLDTCPDNIYCLHQIHILKTSFSNSGLTVFGDRVFK